MYYVYILRSVSFPDETYTGITQDLRQRLSDHNAGKSPHTSKFMPWTIACYFAFPGKATAFRSKPISNPIRDVPLPTSDCSSLDGRPSDGWQVGRQSL